MAANVSGFPDWAARFLRRQGYRVRNVMEGRAREWWGWFRSADEWYGDGSGERPRKMTIRPAKAVCDEYEYLMLDGETKARALSGVPAEWVEGRFAELVPALSGFVARYMAQGTGALALAFEGVSEEPGAASPEARAVVRGYDSFQLAPISCWDGGCDSCAFTMRASVGGREYDQLQVHEPCGGQWRVRTWMFDERSHSAPADVPGVVGDVMTGSPVPTFALVRPALSNVYEDGTPLGASVFSDALDAVRAVDEAFDLWYWSTTLSRPRVLVDETAVVRDPRTGAELFRETAEQMLFRALPGAVGGRQPVTVYAPALRTEEHKANVSLALSLLGVKTGFGASYFSFDGMQVQSAYRTATEVASGNAKLMRTVRKHEALLGGAISSVLAAAWCAEEGLRTGSVCAAVPRIAVEWDDSILEDTATERAMMKDDIARGLCPAWQYPAKYYGMGEADARALTGEGAQAAPEEL